MLYTFLDTIIVRKRLSSDDIGDEASTKQNEQNDII
jgi:hypothetical protein